MTPPPAGPGQANVLKSHYERVGTGAVAYLDETYHVESDGRQRFYVMSAVIVLESDRDPLRDELDSLVTSGWWHTTDELKTNDGRDRTRRLLQTLRVSDETCVIVDKSSVADGDTDGTQARGAVLSRLLTGIHNGEHGTYPAVGLVIVEEHREARMNNYDRAIRKQLVADRAIPASTTLLAISPGTEHLLWLPDLVCSAYRQKMLFEKTDLFDAVEHLAHVVQLP